MGAVVGARRVVRAIGWAWPALGLVVLACAGRPEPASVPDPALESLARRVEAARGLGFGTPVEADFVSREELGPQLEREMQAFVDPEEWARQAALVAAIGLVPDDIDLWAALVELQRSSVVGYYAGFDDRLVVVDPEEGGPLESEVLVHELAHALQARHSKLYDVALGLEGVDDLGFAITAVLEGDATWVAARDQELERGVPVPDGGAYQRRFLVDFEPVGSEILPWLRAMFLLPYPHGYRLVADRAAAQGQAGLDALYADPPLTSAAVLDPDGAEPGRRELSLPVPSIPETCEVVATNALGAVSVAVRLGDRADRDRGWRADRAWHFRCEGGPAWAWLVAAEDEASARELATAFGARRAARSTEARVVRRGARVALFAGLAEDEALGLLGVVEERHYEDLEAWLAAHPEVLERARDRRERGTARPAPRVRSQGPAMRRPPSHGYAARPWVPSSRSAMRSLR